MDGPKRQLRKLNGVELCFFEWNEAARGSGPTLLLTHATGFHARIWDEIVRRLPPLHIVALDQRGHGRSEKVPIEYWDVFGGDLAALVGELDLRDVVGVGHSMGGYATVEAADALPDRFARLVLIDPVIAAPDEYAGGGWAAMREEGWVHPTARRKNRFASPEAMFERFEQRPPFVRWDRAVLRDYCEYGLLPAPDGDGFVLACPPEIEAGIYMASRTRAGIHDAARALEMPVHVVRAKLPPPVREPMDFDSSATWPGLVAELQHGRETHLPEATHFLPFEDPGWTAELIAAEAETSRAA